MNRTVLIRRITSENNGKIFITQSKAAKILGLGKPAVKKMLDGYDYRLGGKGNAHLYLVDDVADAVLRS